jgi:nucleoside-diphosphate-sugar epimerase
MMQKKKYLVTGGSGFIGSALVKALLKAGHTVRVLDDNSRGNLRRLSDVEGKFEWFPGDIRNFEDVSRAVQGVDSVCHLAFINGTEFFYSIPEKVLEVGVKGMMHVLDACIEHQVPELMLMSSSEVYQTPPQVPTDETAPFFIPDPLNARYSYAGGKIISELLAINYGRKHFKRVLIVRPHNVYGPDMGFEHVIPQFALRLKKNRAAGVVDFPIQGSGQESRSFVYIDDFTDGVMCVLNNGSHMGIYHVGTMDELSILALANKLAQSQNVKVNVLPGELTQGSCARRCPDIRKVQALGYTPKVSIEQGLKKTVEWYWNSAETL